MKCPICKHAVLKDAPEFPFCSERCRMADLGNWVSGTYKIPVPVSDIDLLDSPRENNDGAEGEDY